MKQSVTFLFWIGLGLLARLLPHSPNFTPFASLILLTGCQLARRQAVFVTAISLLISDVVLKYVFDYPIFGSWTVFTYSGFILIAFASSKYLFQQRTFVRIATFSISAVLAYWLWTNFGTWMLSGLYPHSGTGLVTCFVAGLPFLQKSFLSALIFEPLFFGLIYLSFLRRQESSFPK